jgi:hypothetical protein
MVVPLKPKVIPATPLFERYRFFGYTTKRERLAQARHFANHPSELAAQFAESVKLFSEGYESDESFFDRRDGHPPRPGPIKHTIDVALRLETAGRISCVEPADGREAPLPESPVVSVPAEDLAFEYVEREITVTRTTGGARWSNGTPGNSRFSMDLLLVDHKDRTPIVTELKIGDDKDAYYAFVQALACLAHLATPAQYARLQKHFDTRGQFPNIVGRPRMDLCVLFVGTRTRGDVQVGIGEAVAELASSLLASDDVAASIRRIIALDMPDDGSLTPTVRFAYGRLS